MSQTNLAVFLRKRPGYHKHATNDCFEVRPIPEPPKPGPEQVLIETLNFSCDPVLRFRMDEHDIQLEYMKQWPLDRPCQGISGVGRVLEVGGSADFKPGDLVACLRGWSWQSRQLFNKSQVLLIANPKLELDLYSYGISALTAYLAVSKADCIMPAGSQTAVVSTACGSVGFVTCQILSLLGCDRVIGLTSTPSKRDYLTKNLDLAAALCYRDPDFAESTLPKACPKGVDVYVDLVGGQVANAVKRLMRKNGHVISVGSISTYQQKADGSDADDEDVPSEISQHLKKNKVNRHNFAVFDFISEWSAGLEQLRQWAGTGDLKLPLCKAVGLESTGAAFVSLMNGGNIGKQIVEVKK